MIRLLTIASALFAGPLHATPHLDLGYRYHHGLSVCRNANGEEGYNPAYMGECGDQRNMDLQGHRLERMNLVGANFSKANLREANFQEAELNGARLTEAKLYSAKFNRARMGRADFRGADLRFASFYWANLQNARLEGADLSHADLRGATLDLAWFNGGTVFTGAVFDEYTSLPFSRHQAKSFGMTYVVSEDSM